MPSPPRLELPADEPPPDMPPPSYEESISQENLLSAPALPARNSQSSLGSYRPGHSPASSVDSAGSHRPPTGPPPGRRPSDSPLSYHRPPSGPPPGHSSNSSLAPPGAPPRKNSTSSSHSSSSTAVVKPQQNRPPQRYKPQASPYLHYPPNFHCHKCNNTGVKYSSGRSCKDCFERFGKPNRFHNGSAGVYAWQGPQGHSPGYSAPYVPNHPNSGYGPGYGPPMGHRPPPGPPRVVRPGDPAIGGVLCGRCRGTGLVSDFLIFEQQCPICRGIGRLVN